MITVSESIADELAQQDGIKRPVVLRNLPENLDGNAPSVDLRDALGLSTQHKLILYQGGIALERGVASVIAALTYLEEHVVFVLLGKCTQPVSDQLLAQAKALGVSERVKFVDEVPYSQLLRYTRSADVGIVPTVITTKSRLYSLPNKLFEYITAEIPVAVSDFPEKRALVEQYDIGAWFDPSDPEDIANAIRSILADPDHYAGLRRNVAKAAQELTWDREQRVLLDVYRGLTTPSEREVSQSSS